jgi:hypothetical protein
LYFSRARARARARAPQSSLKIENPFAALGGGADFGRGLAQWTLSVELKMMTPPPSGCASLLHSQSQNYENPEEAMRHGEDQVPPLLLLLKDGSVTDRAGGRASSASALFQFGPVFQCVTVRRDAFGVVDVFVNGRHAMQTTSWMGAECTCAQ